MSRDVPNRMRALFALARVSGLPTVWSNCLAGWWLGGGGNYWKLWWLFIGMSAIYFGGTFLNDAFDVEFDRQFNFKRPISSGAISLSDALRWAWAWLALGGLCLFADGSKAGLLGLALIFCVIVYNGLHRRLTISPVLLGLCRFLVYQVAATAGFNGVPGRPIWFGLALGVYTVGFGFFAKRRHPREGIPRWPVALLIFPVFFAMLANASGYRQTAMIVGLLLMAWIAVCLRPIFQMASANRRHASAGLFAGIILVDWLAVAPQCPQPLNVILCLLFACTIVAQRFIDR
jgi:4-hydroxybenzoate polyprenyltransferase